MVEDLTGKVLLHLINHSPVIAIGLVSQVRQHYRFYVALTGYFSDEFRRQMSLGGLPHETRPLLGTHHLPAPVSGHVFNPILHRNRLRQEQIGAFRDLVDEIAGTSVPSERDNSIRRLEPIRVGLVFAGSFASVESKMTVLDRRYFEICILVDHSGTNIVPEQNLFYGYRLPASIVRQSDFGAYPVILRGCFDQGGGWRWAVNIDRRLALGIPCNRHQHAKSTSVIIMMVGDENSSDVADVDPAFARRLATPSPASIM